MSKERQDSNIRLPRSNSQRRKSGLLVNHESTESCSHEMLSFTKFSVVCHLPQPHEPSGNRNLD